MANEEPRSTYEDYLLALSNKDQLPPGFPIRPPPVSATFSGGSNQEYKLWMKKKVARDEWDDALKVYLRKQGEGNTEVLQEIIARLNATNEDIKAAEEAMQQDAPPVSRPSAPGGFHGEPPANRPKAPPTQLKRDTKPPTAESPRRGSVKSGQSGIKGFSRVTGFLRPQTQPPNTPTTPSSPTSPAAPPPTQHAAVALPPKQPIPITMILSDEKIAKQQPIPPGFPPPPPTIGKFEGQSQEEYKVWMQRRLIQEEWTNALISYRIKQSSGDTEAMQRIVQRLNESMAGAASLQKKASLGKLDDQQQPAAAPKPTGDQQERKIQYYNASGTAPNNQFQAHAHKAQPGAINQPGLQNQFPVQNQPGGLHNQYAQVGAGNQPGGLHNQFPVQNQPGGLQNQFAPTPVGATPPSRPGQQAPPSGARSALTGSKPSNPITSDSPQTPPPNRSAMAAKPPLSQPVQPVRQPCNPMYEPSPAQQPVYQAPPPQQPRQASDYLGANPVAENSFEALFRDIDSYQPEEPKPFLSESEISLGVFVQDIQQQTKAPILQRPSRQQPPKRLGDIQPQPQRTSLKVVRQNNLAEEQFDLSQLDALAMNPGLVTADPSSPFFDLTLYEVKNSSPTNEAHWEAWAMSTLERAQKENIPISEKPSFQIVESEIGEEQANSIKEAMADDELSMLEVPSEILLDFDDITF